MISATHIFQRSYGILFYFVFGSTHEPVFALDGRFVVLEEEHRSKAKVEALLEYSMLAQRLDMSRKHCESISSEPR